MSALSRRRFVHSASIAGLGLLAGCGRLPGQAQPSTPLPRIGLLAAARDTTSIVRQALNAIGYVHGQNVILESRVAQGNLDQLPDLAADLVRLPVDVLMTTGTPATLAAKEVTSTTPIVQAVGAADLVREGIVASLAWPGGNVTGLTEIVPELTAKRLQLLMDAVPGASRVGVLRQAGSPIAAQQVAGLQAAAQTLGVQLQLLAVSSSDDFASVLGAASREQADALLIVTDPITVAHAARIAARIAALSMAQRLPSMFDRRESPGEGGLMSYGPDTASMYLRAATYVDRILKGTQPGDLPIERPTIFDFIINLRTAQALGLTIPQHVLLQATEIIQ